MPYDNNDDFEYNNTSIYTDEDYQKLTGGKYGKEIFVSHTDSNYNSAITLLDVDEQELRSKIHDSDYFEYTVKTVKKTVRCEDILIRQIMYGVLSSYIGDDPINLGILAPTSEGKTYPVEECIKYFPKQDIYKVGSMSAKVLVRERGILVDGNLNPVDDKIKELKKQRSELKMKKKRK
jgi:hypothetical protein